MLLWFSPSPPRISIGFGMWWLRKPSSHKEGRYAITFEVWTSWHNAKGDIKAWTSRHELTDWSFPCLYVDVHKPSCYVILLYLPTHMRFLIRGERVTCRGSKLTNSLGKQQHELYFGLARDQVVLVETAATLWASRSKANNFFAVFSSFELGGVTKHLMAGPAGNSEFVPSQPQCFPRRVSGNKTHCFLWASHFKSA